MILLLTSLALAEDPKYTKIAESEPAPFAGFLLDDHALNVLTMKAQEGLQCPLEIDYQVGLMEAKKNQELEMIKSEHELEINTLQTTVTEQQERIRKLEKLKKPVNQGVWIAIGAALGVGTTIAIANAVN